jgi:hypothetical protein
LPARLTHGTKFEISFVTSSAPWVHASVPIMKIGVIVVAAKAFRKWSQYSSGHSLEA